MPASFDIIKYPTGLQLTGNLDDIVLRRVIAQATYVKMAIMLNGTAYCQDIELRYDSNNYITIKTRDIAKGLINYQMPDIPVFQPFTQLTISLQDGFSNRDDINIQLIDGYSSANLAAVNSWWQKNFLTWQPQIVTMPRWQPQWLAIAKPDLKKPIAIHIKAKLYTAEGRELSKDIFATTSHGLARLNVSYTELWRDVEKEALTPIAYDIYGLAFDYPTTGEDLATPNSPYAQRYVLRKGHHLDRCFIYQNSLGGFDSIMATGISTYLPTGDNTTFINDGIEQELGGAFSSIWEQNTGYIDNSRIARQWHEFFNSKNRYVIPSTGGGPNEKIVVDEYEVKDKVATLGSYSFKYRLARQDEGAYYSRKDLPEQELPTKFFKDER